jgi:hypothetical protein
MAGRYDDHLPQTHESLASELESLVSGLGNRAAPRAGGRQDGADHGAANLSGTERSLPGLHEEERLPWLCSVEDELGEAGVDPGRVWAFVLTGLAMLLLIVVGVWWITHRGNAGLQLADGSTIAAPPGPIKEAPQDPGGKTFDGTGDSSFTVSQGHVPGATLASGADHVDDVAAADTGSAGPAVAGMANTASGIGVQVGAFSTKEAAEAAWGHLAKSYDALSGSAHRIVEGTADIGTVYRLQAVAGTDVSANALCERLKTAGLNCQVKD